MTNKYLKNTILEIVDNQLKMNEPPCTKQTYERLIESGYTEKEAKEMIGAVVLEDIYYILKDKKKFDEKKYKEKLNALTANNNMSQDTHSEEEDMKVQELFKQIEYNNGTFPKETILEIIHRKDEAIPVLLKSLEEARDNPEKYINESHYFGHIYAIHLLAQFRAKELYPVFIDILKLPDEMPHDLFGDAICEAAGRVLASVSGDNIEPIKEIIEDPDVDEYVRGQAIKALAILALHGILEREYVLEYYKELLNGALQDQNGFVMAEVVCYCDDLYPEEVYADIKNAYARDAVDSGVISLQDVDRTMGFGKEITLSSSRNDSQLQFIDDTIEELENWACFHRNDTRKKVKPNSDSHPSYGCMSNSQTVVKEFKVGRNDPCPCGSGKKYKKCCGS